MEVKRGRANRYIYIYLEFRAIFLPVFFLTFLSFSFSSPRFIIPSHFAEHRTRRIRKKRYYFSFSFSLSLGHDEIKISPTKYTSSIPPTRRNVNSLFLVQRV